MVRLVITDFPSVEENESFYLGSDFDVLHKVFTYDSFKKYSVLLPKYEISSNIYSLNLLSKKHLSNNQLLVHIADEEFYILFNHKTVYRAKINSNFITDDMMKSILITRHIAMLSSGGEIENIYYVINSKYYNAIENILKQNTKNEKHEILAKELGKVEDLVSSMNELDDNKTYYVKLFKLIFTLGTFAWIMFIGLGMVSDKLLAKVSLESIEKQIKHEKRFVKRQERILNKTKKAYDSLIGCISKSEVKND